jgi:murein DD-endopeptidase MepM/ murein hydrolase activator NlpD
MPGVPITEPNLSFGRLLRERQLYVRSGDGYRTIVLRSGLQLLVLTLAAATLAGAVWLGLEHASARDTLARQAEEIAALRQALDESRASGGAEARRLRDMTADLEAIDERQRETIAHLSALQETLQRELDATRAEAAAVAGERDAARQGLAALHEGVAEREIVASATDAARTALEAQVKALDAQLASVASERDLARRSEKGLRWRVGMLETRLAEARKGGGGETARLRAWIVSHVSALESVLERSGVDVEQMIQRVGKPLSTGRGGPLVPALAKEPPLPSIPSEPGLVGDLSRLQRLHRLLGSVPFAAPLVRYQATSGFGVRQDPFTGKDAMHEGLDFGGEEDARALATNPGLVVVAGSAGAYGNLVEIDHGMGVRTRYAHLKEVLVRMGERVEFHAPVGVVGSTGRSTGDHLHYEIRIDGRPLDPANFLEAGRRLKNVLKG